MLLQVEDLTVSFASQPVVRGISFTIKEGEAVGVVGESGSGKTATVQGLTRLEPHSRVEGKVLFRGKNILKMGDAELRAIRGKEIGMVFQDPLSSLNPTMKIGNQIMESLLHHRLCNRKEAERKALELLSLTGIPHPRDRFSQYPHELSGGMRQRVMIAIAVSCHPKLLIADEPTTALDATIQAQILRLLKQMQTHFQMSLLLITHDLGVVASLCERILVLYQGQIVEQGGVEEILFCPQHPYTKTLLRARPSLEAPVGTH